MESQIRLHPSTARAGKGPILRSIRSLQTAHAGFLVGFILVHCLHFLCPALQGEDIFAEDSDSSDSDEEPREVWRFIGWESLSLPASRL